MSLGSGIFLRLSSMLWTSASSWMMQRHSSMHSSQIYAEGPATSFLTSFWVFPQKEQNRMPSPPSLSLCLLGMFPSLFLDGRGPLLDHRVDEPVLARLFTGHVVVAVGVFLDPVDRLIRVPGEDLVELMFEAQHLPGLDFHVRRLAREPAHRLVDQDPGVRKRVSLSLLTRSQEDGRHAGSLPHAIGRNRSLDVLHGVVDRKPRTHESPRGVDVEMDLLVGVFRFQVQKLCDDEVGHIVVDGNPQKDNPVFQEPGVDVEGPLASSILFNDYRDQWHVLSFIGVAAFHLILALDSIKSRVFSSSS